MTSDIRHDPLAELSAQGVAVWLDDLSRELLGSGELQSLITGRHVVGVTTNPTILASALAKGDRYDPSSVTWPSWVPARRLPSSRSLPMTSAPPVTPFPRFTSRQPEKTGGSPSKSTLGWPVTPTQPRTWPAPCDPLWTATTCS